MFSQSVTCLRVPMVGIDHGNRLVSIPRGEQMLNFLALCEGDSLLQVPIPTLLTRVILTIKPKRLL